MIKVDLSKAVPPRFGTYLLGLIPGIFFESSIAIGNPRFVAPVMCRLREIYPFGSYALLLLFLASSLIVGTGFFLAAWVVQGLVFFGFVLGRFLIRATFGSQWLYRRFSALQAIPPKRIVFVRLLSKLIFWARDREFSMAARPVLECLHIATKRLLKKRYGIDLPHSHAGWGIWYSVVGEPLKGIQEGILASRTFLGCGLAGFTAIYASPALRERYFVSLCSVFALSSLFLTFDLAFWNVNAVRRSTLQLKSVLLAISKSAMPTEKVSNEQSSISPSTEEDQNE